MPQGENFWNPYRLIPAKERVERSAPVTDERFSGTSGILECTLENLTPLFVGAKPSGTLHPPLLRDGKRVVPGSSLKGMLRSLAEIVGGGCFVVSDPKSPVPPQMKACSDVRRLCIACRLFGAMERGRNARVHKGKVSVSDALVREENIRTKSLQVLLANNGVRHEPFYRSSNSGRLDGKSRKMYFHQPVRKDSVRPVEESIRDRAWNVDAILPGHHFDFEVQFNSLTEDEFSLLLYVLNLEERVETAFGEDNLALSGPMRHKIGNAKPLGMGSCHIRTSRMTIFPLPLERFRALNADNNRVLNGEELNAEILRRTRLFCQDNSPTMQALRKMMVWDENDPRDFHYPDYKRWFDKKENKSKPLKTL